MVQDYWETTTTHDDLLDSITYIWIQTRQIGNVETPTTINIK
jgi:hypothetical protein